MKYLDLSTNDSAKGSNVTTVLGNFNGSFEEPSLPSPSSITSWFVLSTTFHLFGGLTNLSLIIAAYNDRQSRPGSRLLVANLAFAGFLLSLVLSFGVTVATYFSYLGLTWLLPHPGHCVFYAMYQVAIAATSWADVCLAVNRLAAICFPHQYNRVGSRKVSALMIAIAWAISIIDIGLHSSGKFGGLLERSSNGLCSLRVTERRGGFLVFLTVVIPYALVGVASVPIFITAFIKIRAARMSPQPQRRGTVLKKRLVIAKAMLASLIWCCLCAVPYTAVWSVAPRLFVQYQGLTYWLKVGFVAEFAINPYGVPNCINTSSWSCEAACEEEENNRSSIGTERKEVWHNDDKILCWHCAKLSARTCTIEILAVVRTPAPAYGTLYRSHQRQYARAF
ncbi:hypothetical protein RvY_00376 [Ramazzottius varieornatus]|uniref:G-protein coupled receptors family 1 profile domain-containing protein n=1 Tax=Ramazzottius varieornatus TaxID=947166 RepID=A0A1D1UD09_RAMVA|nr:hypothetical protein RvY_00376 [Ramazzottius varieornatus]